MMRCLGWLRCTSAWKTWEMIARASFLGSVCAGEGVRGLESGAMGAGLATKGPSQPRSRTHPVLPQHCVEVRPLAEVQDGRKRRVVDLKDVQQADDVGVGQRLGNMRRGRTRYLV